jgi:crotonobetainyl-CoA:carnitine CoA-transferase CaiB-like acyl-CoA transferase
MKRKVQHNGTPRFSLLAGIKVLDLTNSIAGPYATMQLADLGADVVKVEQPPKGDDARAWGPPFLNGASLWFLSSNRNKLGLSLDYSQPAGRAVLSALIEKADVLVTNFRPTLQNKFGIDYATTSKLRPSLIHCSITGFGLTGPKREFACYDLIAEGYSGVMDLTGEADGLPQKVGTPAADLLAGMDAAYGIVSALFDRQRTGKGHQVDISLVESMTRFMAPRIVPFMGSGSLPRRTGARDSVIAIYQTFDTADEPITLGLGSDAVFRRFCAAIGKPDWAEDSRNGSNALRRERRASLVEEIQTVLKSKGREHWLVLFSSHSVPSGPIYRLDEVVRDEQLLERNLFFSMNGNDVSIPQVGTGWHLDGEPNVHTRPPPELGQDTQDVLATWLDMPADKIEQLSRERVI